jgi:hypothetical protein
MSAPMKVFGELLMSIGAASFAVGVAQALIAKLGWKAANKSIAWMVTLGLALITAGGVLTGMHAAGGPLGH